MAATNDTAARPPQWKEDASAPACQGKVCGMKFTMVNRKHHCRACGGVFCDKCTGIRIPLPQYGYSKRVRVCDVCAPLAAFQLSLCGVCRSFVASVNCKNCNNLLCAPCSAKVHLDLEDHELAPVPKGGYSPDAFRYSRIGVVGEAVGSKVKALAAVETGSPQMPTDGVFDNSLRGFLLKQSPLSSAVSTFRRVWCQVQSDRLFFGTKNEAGYMSLSTVTAVRLLRMPKRALEVQCGPFRRYVFRAYTDAQMIYWASGLKAILPSWVCCEQVPKEILDLHAPREVLHGTLLRKGGRFSRWAEKSFRLDDGTLYCHKLTGTNCLAVMPLHRASCYNIEGTEADGVPNAFVVSIDANRTWTLAARSHDERDVWVRGIKAESNAAAAIVDSWVTRTQKGRFITSTMDDEPSLSYPYDAEKSEDADVPYEELLESEPPAVVAAKATPTGMAPTAGTPVPASTAAAGAGAECRFHDDQGCGADCPGRSWLLSFSMGGEGNPEDPDDPDDPGEDGDDDEDDDGDEDDEDEDNGEGDEDSDAAIDV